MTKFEENVLEAVTATSQDGSTMEIPAGFGESLDKLVGIGRSDTIVDSLSIERQRSTATLPTTAKRAQAETKAFFKSRPVGDVP